MSFLATEVKLIWAICLSITLLTIASLNVQLLLMLFLLVISFFGNIKLKDIFNYAKVFLPIFIIIFLINLFYYTGDVFFKVWFLRATDAGLHAALFNLIRLINFLLVTMCFFTWTSPLELASKITSVFGVSRARFFQELAMVFFIAVRFLPFLLRERDTVKLAMRARGAKFEGGLVRRIKMNSKLVLPLFSRVIGQIDDVVAALALKSNGDTFFAPAKSGLKFTDTLLIIAAIFLTVSLMVYA